MDKEKCSVKDGKFVEPCKSLNDVTEFGHPKGKQRGVWCWEYSIEGKPSRRFFGAKSGSQTEKGLAFNFCPFCGEPIDAPFVTPNAPHEGPALVAGPLDAAVGHQRKD